mmetsp:Transcript_9410/g.22453  ORF Transcript_9410/g.22453 Transcript_9410/m.22453 type:complete len:262 (-) Transcript_9410:255-1040(-)
MKLIELFSRQGCSDGSIAFSSGVSIRFTSHSFCLFASRMGEAMCSSHCLQLLCLETPRLISMPSSFLLLLNARQSRDILLARAFSTAQLIRSAHSPTLRALLQGSVKRSAILANFFCVTLVNIFSSQLPLGTPPSQGLLLQLPPWCLGMCLRGGIDVLRGVSNPPAWRPMLLGQLRNGRKLGLAHARFWHGWRAPKRRRSPRSQLVQYCSRLFWQAELLFELGFHFSPPLIKFRMSPQQGIANILRWVSGGLSAYLSMLSG